MKRGKSKEKSFEILIRYLLLLVISIFGVPLIYSVFLPLTKYPVFYILTLFYEAVLTGNFISIGEYTIEIVGACVAGSAYYLLIILNLGTPGIKSTLRVKMVLLSFLIFLILNIIRIIVLSVLFVNNSPYFDFFHKILWYAGSTIIVVLIWFVGVRHYKIKGIPFYSDLKSLYKSSILKQK